MKKRIFIVTLVALLTGQASSAQDSDVTGLFSTLRLSEESGDSDGAEIHIVRNPTGYSATVQASEGALGIPEVVNVLVKGTMIEFSIPKNPASGFEPGTYFGIVTKEGLELRGPKGLYESYFMPRKIVTREAKSSDFIHPGRFTFSAGGFQYSVTANGVGLRSGERSVPQSFRLPLDSGRRIERLWYLQVEHDIVLVYEDHDGEIGAGVVVRLTGQRLQRRWSAKIPGFNIGEGLMDDEHLYITAIGFVGKLNLKTGQYAWAHKDLYADGRFNAFKRPVVRDSVVTFTDGSNTIVVDKQTGARAP